jgi:hypothetical protein
MIDGLPVVLLVWLIEAALLITIIKPESAWALTFSNQRQGLAAQERRPRPDGISDFVRLIGYAILIVFAMAAIEISVNLLFGKK